MMKFGKLIQYIERNVFIHKLYRQRKEGDSIKSYFLKKKKALYQVKARCLLLSFSTFRQPSI